MNRRLLRTAGRLQVAYSASRGEGREIELPESAWLDVQRTLRRCTLSRRRGWAAAAAIERESLAMALEYLGIQLQNRVLALQGGERRPAPTLRTLYDELVATEAEFGGLDIEDAALTVTTEPIALEGIELGPFQIRLNLDRIGGEASYTVVALEPNPASSCADTTHPHVNGDRLCPGEGWASIRAALEEGRLFDFFTIVERILHTYAAGSAYVELDRWFGPSCHDCDVTIDQDDACICPSCEETLCNDCLVCCGNCSSGHCSNCIGCCADCEDRYCSGCLMSCHRCRREVCPSCLENDLCTTCLEELENELEEEVEQISSASSSASVEPAV
jgi:hypothetical protein